VTADLRKVEIGGRKRKQAVFTLMNRAAASGIGELRRVEKLRPESGEVTESWETF
jgi:hypothetical protein